MAFLFKNRKGCDSGLIKILEHFVVMQKLGRDNPLMQEDVRQICEMVVSEASWATHSVGFGKLVAYSLKAT